MRRCAENVAMRASAEVDFLCLSLGNVDDVLLPMARRGRPGHETCT